MSPSDVNDFGRRFMMSVRSGAGVTTFSELMKDVPRESASTFGLHQYSSCNNQVGRSAFIGKQRLRIMPRDDMRDQNISPQAYYVRSSCDKNFPDMIRVYDANSFACSTFGQLIPQSSLKDRLSRSIRAFVNVWRMR